MVAQAMGRLSRSTLRKEGNIWLKPDVICIANFLTEPIIYQHIKNEEYIIL